MEYPTLITTGGEWYWPWIGVRYLEQVTVHELGHQWFYGLVATDESRYPFLDEGLTTYAEMRGLERLHPGSSAAGALGLQISLTAAARLWASEAWDEDVIAKPAADFATGSEYGALVYAKAALLLATLERAYGREKFDAALGRYAREHRFGHPRPEQLIAAVQAELGAGAAEQLRTGVYERSWVDYAVERVGARRVAVSASEPEGSTGDGRQRATHRRAAVADGGPWESFVDVRRRGSLAFPVVVELATSSGSRHRIEWDGQEARARLTVRTTEPVRAAVVDPDYRVLLDRDWSNNARSAAAPSPAAQIAPRVWAYAAHAAQLVLSGVAP